MDKRPAPPIVTVEKCMMTWTSILLTVDAPSTLTISCMRQSERPRSYRGSGCLSLEHCRFANPGDRAARLGPDPRYWIVNPCKTAKPVCDEAPSRTSEEHRSGRGL